MRTSFRQNSREEENMRKKQEVRIRSTFRVCKDRMTNKTRGWRRGGGGG